MDFGGGPRTNKLDNPVSYYFHDSSKPGLVTHVASAKIIATRNDSDYRIIAGWTGSDARAAQSKAVVFPQILTPVDDLPPSTLITGITAAGARRVVSGVSHDDGEIATITVNGVPATITAQHAGVADWNVTIDAPAYGRYAAKAIDRAANEELIPHDVSK